MFTLRNWVTQEEIVQIEILTNTKITHNFKLPEPPKSFVDLLGKCSDEERKWTIQIRDLIYQFARDNNYKIAENPDGKWTRFQRTKQYPIAEVGWDNRRATLAIYLWLPFTTINGRDDMGKIWGERYKRTAMMRLWVVNGFVKYIGYIENGRKSWLIVTSDELEDRKFSLPTKLKKWRGDDSYWKGLAMPIDYYLKMMKLSESSNSLIELVELALNYSLQRQKKAIKVKPCNFHQID